MLLTLLHNIIRYPGIDPWLESIFIIQLKTAVNTDIFKHTLLQALLVASLCFWKLRERLAWLVNQTRSNC